MLFGGTGFFIDKFHSHKGDGILWPHGYGNVFEKTLAAGETIDVEPGGWLYKETTVRMDTIVDRITPHLRRQLQPGGQPLHRTGPDRHPGRCTSTTPRRPDVRAPRGQTLPLAGAKPPVARWDIDG